MMRPFDLLTVAMFSQQCYDRGVIDEFLHAKIRDVFRQHLKLGGNGRFGEVSATVRAAPHDGRNRSTLRQPEQDVQPLVERSAEKFDAVDPRRALGLRRP
jgi:hypothetical protein